MQPISENPWVEAAIKGGCFYLFLGHPIIIIPRAIVIIVIMFKVWSPIKVTVVVLPKHVISFMVNGLSLRCFNLLYLIQKLWTLFARFSMVCSKEDLGSEVD